MRAGETEVMLMSEIVGNVCSMAGRLPTILAALLLSAIIVPSRPFSTTDRVLSERAMPAPTDVFIGLDVGTQSTKGIAYDASSQKILGRASSGYDILPSHVDGRAEQDTAEWVKAVTVVLRELVSELGLKTPSPGERRPSERVLSGVGVSGQQHGMVLLDANFQPLRPAKLWCDVEAVTEAQYVQSIGNGKWDHVVPSFTAPKVLWTMKNEPGVWNRTRWVVLPHDYINLVLRGGQDSGEVGPTTDRGDASGSGLYDVQTNAYCEELARQIDASGRYAQSLPKILEPLDLCGSLSALWMENIGLMSGSETEIPYIPISVGSGDNMCSALGVGCVETGSAVLSLGTSGTIFGVSDSPPSSLVSPFADATGKYLPLGCVMSCTAVLQSVLDSFFDKIGDGDKTWTHDEATELASQHPPGCYGITFLPYLSPGERTPDWPHAKGAILGLTAQNMALATSGRDDGAFDGPTNPMAGLVYRAAMEGVTYLLAEALETMKEACGEGFQLKSLLVVGGGSHNKLWRQMLADVLNVELRFPLEKESAALGAAFQVAAAVEASQSPSEARTLRDFVLSQPIEMEDAVVTPTTDEEASLLYQKARRQYCDLANRLYATER